MNAMTDRVASVAAALVSGGRGLVAFEVPDTEAPGWERYVGGALLSDESIRGTGVRGSAVGALRARGIVPGVALSGEATVVPGTSGEPLTEGLDGARRRLTEYALLGAGFATWRARFRAVPSDGAIDANADALARFAAFAQESGIVPVIELDIRNEGAHTIAAASLGAERVLRRTLDALARAGVAFDGLVLAPTMVLAGDMSPLADVNDVVASTLRVLGATVPVAVAGIAFLIDAQARIHAAQRLSALNRAMPRRRPWPLSFTARRLLLHRAYCLSAAACGAYTAKLEDPRTLPLAA